MNPGLFSLFAGAPAAVQAHVRVRWLTCPVRAVVAKVPTQGRILEVGCGYGLFSLEMAIGSPGRSVVGVDIDTHKVVHAQRAGKIAVKRGAQVSFELSPPGEVPEGLWDAVVVIDVLYLLDAEEQEGLLRTCAGALAPGGVLVVKEMAPEPRWKARWNRIQETASVKVLGITAGSDFAFLPPSTLGGWMEEEGLRVSHERLDRRYPHPHHLVVGRRPTLTDLRRGS